MNHSRLTAQQHETILRSAADPSLSMLDIALEADCSKGTVQRLLRGRPGPSTGRRSRPACEMARLLVDDAAGMPRERIARRYGYASAAVVRSIVRREKERRFDHCRFEEA